MNNQLKLFDVRWVSHTGGPSPYDNNARTELFLMGCKKARLGVPCKGCFNQKLWADIADARLLDPEDMANHIAKFAPNKFITIVGGEPLDQLGGLDMLEAETRRNIVMWMLSQGKGETKPYNSWTIKKATWKAIRENIGKHEI